jgi:hypothetical protein
MALVIAVVALVVAIAALAMVVGRALRGWDELPAWAWQLQLDRVRAELNEERAARQRLADEVTELRNGPR